MHDALPRQVHVFVRDWLSANNILLKSSEGHVLVDSGYGRHVPLTLALLETSRGLNGEPLALLANTHCHSDHMGGNAAVARKYRCPVAVPEGEAPLIANWDTRALWLDYAGQSAERFAVNEILRPDTSYTWGDLEWRALAAPGHDMGALVFFNPEHRILISGDALWQHGFGIVMPPEIDPAALSATRATLEMLGRLDVRMARHVLKVMLIFSLLDRQRMKLDEMPGYFAGVPIYREFNAAFFRLPPDTLAQRLVGELEGSGAVTCENGWLRPA
jgi:glyoxylase-like metal-dependent hydrolase (beta-lactamase superfamily II)